MNTNRFQVPKAELYTAFKPGAVAGVMLLAALFLLSACLPLPARPPTEDIDAIYTISAQTVVAQFTEKAGTADAEITRQPEQPPATRLATSTATQPDQAQATEAPSATPLPPSPTPLPPSATPTTLPCDQAQLVGDMTVPEETILPTGSQFNKIWRVRNTGACTWTPDYALVFVGGDPMGSITVFSLSRAVNPEETADLTAMLTVPDTTGIYQGGWMLRNPSGMTFGVGVDGSVPFQVRVRAIQSAGQQPGVYDFAANFCAASWLSRIAPLTCPGLSQDDNGSVILLSQPTLESGQTSQYGLWARPDRNLTGQIVGVYPPYTVREYDHFRSVIGCLGGRPNCDVLFHLQFQTPGGVITDLGSWREIYDGLTTNIDIDLYLLAGRSGNFILTVDNIGDPQAADAVWLAPRIQNDAPSASLVLSWIREGRRETACDDELQIFLSAPAAAEARASYCVDGDKLLSNGPLTADELAQLLTWMQRLAAFQAEVFRASPVDPLISWIEFKGMGNETARQVDIEAVESFAAQLFNRMASIP
jgi:hypothetical protein